MLKNTAIAALLASASFASTDATVSALRLHHRISVVQQTGVPINPSQGGPFAPQVGVPIAPQMGVPMAGVPVDAANMAPLSAGQVGAALAGDTPGSEVITRDASAQPGTTQRRRGCCSDTCEFAHYTCCTPYGAGRDAAYNAHMVRTAAQVGTNPTGPSAQTMSRENEEDNCSCAGVQCPTYHGCGCHSEGECGCCRNGVDAVCNGGQAVVRDGCNFASEVGGMVTGCRGPSPDFCVVPAQCSTEMPSLSCSVPQCPTDGCCCPELDLSQCGPQCGNLATQGVAACGKCAECPCKACDAVGKCLGGCGDCPAF